MHGTGTSHSRGRPGLLARRRRGLEAVDKGLARNIGSHGPAGRSRRWSWCLELALNAAIGGAFCHCPRSQLDAPGVSPPAGHTRRYRRAPGSSRRPARTSTAWRWERSRHHRPEQDRRAPPPPLPTSAYGGSRFSWQFLTASCLRHRCDFIQPAPGRPSARPRRATAASNSTRLGSTRDAYVRQINRCVLLSSSCHLIVGVTRSQARVMEAAGGRDAPRNYAKPGVNDNVHKSLGAKSTRPPPRTWSLGSPALSPAISTTTGSTSARRRHQQHRRHPAGGAGEAAETRASTTCTGTRRRWTVTT